MTVPETMKAVVTRGYGGLDMLDYTDVPVPVPGEDEVLVQVTACGMNNTDIWAREGAYGTDRDPGAVTANRRGGSPFPVIQGLDIVGRIVGTGARVPAARVGERVICNCVLYEGDPWGVGFSGVLGSARDGGYAEYTVVPAENAYDVGTSTLSDAELATFACAYITAEHMLEAAGVGAGETVLVTGTSGGAGSAVVQLAHAREARVVAVTSARWADQVRGLGPHAVVLRDQGDLVDQIEAATGAGGVAVVADVVGGPHFPDYLAVLANGGRYVTAGAMAGPVVAFDLRTMYLKKLTLLGVTLGLKAHFEAVLGHLEAGRIRPLLGRTFPLSDFKAAESLFMSKDFFGNIVILPGAG